MGEDGITINTNGIAIIEFLGPEEYRAGESIFQSYIRPTWKDCPNQFHFYAPTREKLMDALNGIAQAARDQGFHPLVHIESHGTEDGLALAPGSPLVTWKEIKPIFQKINRYAEFNTVLMVSACNGAHFISAMEATEPAPFWGILGPIDIARTEHLLEDFGSFYRSFLTDYNFGKAYGALNAHKDGSVRNYHFYTADHFFLNLWAAYMKTQGSPAAIDRRVTRMMSKGPSVAGAGKKACGNLRRTFRAGLSDHETNFERFKRTFFMEDILPGMADRFGVTYEKALARLASM